MLGAGAESIRDFARMFADSNDVRQTASSEFGIELEAGLRGRLQVARLVMAWEAANAQAARMANASEQDEAVEAQRAAPSEGGSEGSGAHAASQQMQTEQQEVDLTVQQVGQRRPGPRERRKQKREAAPQPAQGPAKAQRCKRRTPDKHPICFRFNNPDEACDGKCYRKHVCGLCYKEGSPMYSCSHEP